MTVAQTDAARPAAETAAPRQYVNFMFFKVDHGFRQQDAVFKSEAKREFAEVVERYVPDRMMLFPYSTVGLKSTTDFMLWRITYDLESFQQMSADINKTRLGRYLDTISYLSMTKHSQYVGEHVHEGQEGRRLRIVPGKRPWLFVYPFVKTRDWYLLPQADRQRIMNEHIAIGHKYPRVKINTTYSFGLDDQDFVVAFEADSAAEFLDLVQELRETESSKYTLRDTPMYTCRRATIDQILESIG
jgi:chlorite dismutase